MMRRQTGAVLVMLVILIVVLIGVAALALDVGRLFVLRTEMQNGVDAAALAAATELDGRSDAQNRAIRAAKTLIEQDSHFSKVRALLGETLDDNEIAFKFFCAIENDSKGSNLDAECTGGLDETEGSKYKAISDADSHYVRVILNPVVDQNSDEARYSIDLYFLPILNMLGLDVPTEASTTAAALAGRSFMMCSYPPLMICNPYELTGGELSVGQQIKLFMGASSPSFWAPGDFGLLEPPSGGGGAIDVSKNLATPAAECTDPYITTKTGVAVNMVKWGLNTRFGIYEFSYNVNNYPPAHNVLDYPRDVKLAADPNEKIGDGVWQSTPGQYWTDYTHANTDPGLTTRYDYYLWEIANDDYPVKAVPPSLECNPIENKGCATDSLIWKGRPNPDNKLAATEMRVITVPVLNCSALGLTGKEKDIWVPQQEYWKKFFITEHVNDPSGGAEIFAEYLGTVDSSEGTYRVEVKLYE